MAKWSASKKPWERQEGESPQAFEAFDLYCKMGTDRSLHKVGTKLAKSYTIISRWSSKWEWQKRSREYDNELKRQDFAEQKREYRKMQQRQIQTATLLQKKAVEALAKLEWSDLDAKDIMRFISEGTKLERMNRAESVTAFARDANTDGQASSLADTIVAAYQKRMEDGEQ